MMYSKYYAMSDAELSELAKEKTKRGNATAKALRAQHALWERHQWDEAEEHKDYERCDYK